MGNLFKDLESLKKLNPDVWKEPPLLGVLDILET